MKLQQTREILEQEDYDIFYKKFKGMLYPNVRHAIFLNVLMFILIIISQNSLLFEYNVSGISNVLLVIYIIANIPICKDLFLSYRFYQEIHKYTYKIIWKGKIEHKLHKPYLIDGKTKYVPVLSFANDELMVSSNVFDKFYVNDLVCLHSLQGKDDFFRYELL